MVAIRLSLSLPVAHWCCELKIGEIENEFPWDFFQIGLIFGKVPNVSLPLPSSLRMVPISRNHEHAFHTIWPFCLLAYMQPYPLQKICNIIFQKWGGGPKAVWNVSKKSFDLVARPFPYTDFDAFTVADTQTYKIRFSALSFWTKLKGRRQKKWYFLGIFPKPVHPPSPWIHFGTKM